MFQEKKYLLYLGIAVCALLLGIFTTQISKEMTVARTAQGFAPQKILIHKGDTVRFINETRGEIWPASDFHPTHTLYPEFDPTRPIESGETWRFVFEKAGVWTYHDHLSSDMHGTVIVTGELGEATKECLSKTATSSIKAVCWEGDVTDALEKKGLEEAFGVFKSIYAQYPEFRGLNCHDATHILGAAAYRAYASDHTVIDRPETSYCGYGFYHGFMETMLLQEGPGQYERVRAYCESLKTGQGLNNPAGACYHGIGHAAFDSVKGTLWGDNEKMVDDALGACEKAALGGPERVQCSTGVYNALANAASAGTYDLSFSYPDPLKICRIQKQEYQKGCFSELGLGVIRDEKLDRAASLHLIESLEDIDGASQLLLGYVGDEVKRSIASIDLGDFHDLCTSFASQKNQDACTRGVISGLREGGEPGNEYKLMFRYCGLSLEDSQRIACYAFAISQARGVARDRSEFQKACLAMGADIQPLCK